MESALYKDTIASNGGFWLCVCLSVSDQMLHKNWVFI
jgi:hypothetical protein